VDPVVLLIDSVNVLVIVVAVGHELHKSPPDRVAPTNVKSPEEHDVPGGGYDCANEAEILSKLNIKNTNNFFEKVIFVFIQLNLVEYNLLINWISGLK
jgi:hypothetical protein